jgi:hypothetical protein
MRDIKFRVSALVRSKRETPPHPQIDIREATASSSRLIINILITTRFTFRGEAAADQKETGL